MAIRKPTVSEAYVSIGLFLVVVEALFFERFGPTGLLPIRNIIGYHLYPTEIWFIVVGFLVLFFSFASGSRKYFPERLGIVFVSILSTILLLFVALLWSSMLGNHRADVIFRELVFPLLAAVPTLFIAENIKLERVLRRFSIGFVVALNLIFFLNTISATDVVKVHNVSLVVLTLPVAYFVLHLDRKRNILWLLLSLLPIATKFAKPMVMLGLFVFANALLIVTARHRFRWKLRYLDRSVVLLSAVASIVMVAALFWVVINETSDHRLSNLFRERYLKIVSSGPNVYEQRGDVSGGRFDIWAEAMREWSRRPFLGYGLGSELLVPSQRSHLSRDYVKIQLHNYPVQLLYNTGVVGFVVLLLWYWYFYRIFRYFFSDLPQRVYFHYYRPYLTVALFVTGIAFYGLYGHSLSWPPVPQLFGFGIGVLANRVTIERPHNDPLPSAELE